MNLLSPLILNVYPRNKYEIHVFKTTYQHAVYFIVLKLYYY